MAKSKKSNKAIPSKLFLFNCEDIDAVARLFNGSICYELTWNNVWASVKNREQSAQSTMNDEELLIACNYLLQFHDGMPTTKKGRMDIAVVLNPAKRYLSVKELWLSYSTAILVRGGLQARKLHELAYRLSLNEVLTEHADDIHGSISARDTRKYVPFARTFMSNVRADRKAIVDSFRDQFVV